MRTRKRKPPHDWKHCKGSFGRKPFVCRKCGRVAIISEVAVMMSNATGRPIACNGCGENMNTMRVRLQ